MNSLKSLLGHPVRNVAFLFLLLLGVVATATTLKQLCTYDKYCRKLLDGAGDAKEPDEALVNLLKRNRGAISAAARRYGVDPRAIVGSILAENTLNVSKTDDVQNFLSRVGVAKGVRALGGNIGTIGLGQINCSTAMHVERYFAAKEKRGINSNVCSELDSVGGSINNVAKILRHAQEVYAAHGINIGNNIPVLTTLYNLGKVEQRAAATKQSGVAPRMNYFGFFVGTQGATLNSVVGAQRATAPAPRPQVQTAKPPTPKKGKAQPAVTEKLKEATEDAPDETELAKTEGYKVSRELQMFDMVPACRETSGEHTRMPVNPTPKQNSFAKGAKLNEVGRAVDCEMKAWILVESEDGKAGWVRESELLKNASKTVEVGTRECKVSDPKCDTKVDAMVGPVKSFLIDTDDVTGAHEFQVSMISSSRYEQSALKQRKKISTVDTASSCFAANEARTPSQGKGAAASKSEPLTEADVRALTAKLESKVAGWKSDSAKLKKAANFLSDLYYCQSGCSVDKAQLSKFIDGEPVQAPEIVRAASSKSKHPSESQIGEVLAKCMSLFPNDYDSFYFMEQLASSDRTNPYDLSKAPTVAKIHDACKKEIPNSKTSMQASAGCTNCGTDLSKKTGSDTLRALIKSELGITSSYTPGNVDVLAEAAKARLGVKCMYSPGSTLTQMQTFADSDCVSYVTAPDLPTFAILSKLYPNKVVMMTYPKKDRYSVHYKNTCKVAKASK